jgi:hypothetical protein
VKKIHLFALLHLLALQTWAQKKVDSHATYWLRYSETININSHVYWINEFDNRRFFNPDTENQLIIHSRIHRKTGRWDYGGGIALSWAYNTKAEDHTHHATNEVRPQAEVNYEIPFKRWSLSQRVRLDNRFIEEDKYATVFDGSTYDLRMRYRIQAKVPLQKDERWFSSARLSNEIMINDRKNTFDQDRIYFAIDHNLSKKFTLETGYIYIYQQRFGKDEFLQRNVLRLSIFHKFSLHHS